MLMALESKIKQAKETLRNEQIARALKDFVQDDDKTSTQNNAATLVLSSLMTQHIPDVMQQVCYLSYPQFTGYPKVPFRALSRGTAKDNNGKARPLTMKNSSGEVEPVTVKGVGGDAIFALSRDGENFKVTLNYPTYVEARPGRENEFPLHENGVVLIHLKTEILVNGDQARDGKLEIAMPNGIQAEYSGRLMLS